MPKSLSIIMPSYQDPRIAEAIASVRRFDDVDAVRILVIDGGSKPEILDLITPLLTAGDVLISERDRGIFDALNKGLDLADSEFIGWLGSDDLFSGRLLASEVLEALRCFDLLVAGLVLFNEDRVKRLTHAWPSRFRLARFGLHNPHFATFGRAALLKSERFDLSFRGADIAYFLAVFAKKPRVLTTGEVAVLQGEGGYSTTSYRKSIDVNMELLPVYARYTNALVAPFALMIKLGYKFWSSIYYRIFRVAKDEFEVSSVK